MILRPVTGHLGNALFCSGSWLLRVSPCYLHIRTITKYRRSRGKPSPLSLRLLDTFCDTCVLTNPEGLNSDRACPCPTEKHVRAYFSLVSGRAGPPSTVIVQNRTKTCGGPAISGILPPPSTNWHRHANDRGELFGPMPVRCMMGRCQPLAH